MKFPSLRLINNVLGVIVIGLCLYLIIAPFWPQAAYKLEKDPPLVAQEKANAPPAAIPADNTLVIPSVKLQQVIHEGGKWALNKGVWRQPSYGATPAKGGNTVLSGHRFTYAGQAVFYHLDKVKQGDRIVIYWQKQRYQYEVKSIKVVPPTAKEVTAPTEEPTLTIYTCTPVWSAKNRLVIQAKLLEDNR